MIVAVTDALTAWVAHGLPRATVPGNFDAVLALLPDAIGENPAAR
jgi:hypothetical protein